LVQALVALFTRQPKLQIKLTLVAQANSRIRFLLRTGECWQEQRRKDSDDRYDNEKFDKRECVSRFTDWRQSRCATIIIHHKICRVATHNPGLLLGGL
jgi:hypothetical protein